MADLMGGRISYTFQPTPYRTVYLVLSAIFGLFVILTFIVPFLNEPGTLLHLNGDVGVMDHKDIWNNLDPFSNFMYSIGDIGCHQSHGRTLHLNDNEMPFCIRDTFIFIGFSLGFLLYALGFHIEKNQFFIGVSLVAITLVEWAIEHYLDIGGAFIRAVVSLVSGIGAVMIFDSVLMAETRFFDKLSEKKKK